MCRRRTTDRVVKIISFASILAAVVLYFANGTGKRQYQNETIYINKEVGKYFWYLVTVPAFLSFTRVCIGVLDS